jgi:hypothetical protein
MAPRRGIFTAWVSVTPIVSRGRSPPGQRILGDEIAIFSRLQREAL